MKLVQQVGAMARKGALVANLERSDFGILRIYLLTASIFREPMTRFDVLLLDPPVFFLSRNETTCLGGRLRTISALSFPVCRQAIWQEGPVS